MKTIGKYQIQIGGMHCASCAQRLTKALSAFNGVSYAEVNFSTETANIEIDSNVTNLKALRAEIEKNGFSVVFNQVTINVGGMHCASCAQSVRVALLEIPEIADASVNPVTETASMKLFTQEIPFQLVKQKIKMNGYEYNGVEGSADVDLHNEQLEKEQRMRLIRLIVSFGFSIPLMVAMYVPSLYHLIDPLWVFFSSTPVFLFVAFPIYKIAFINLRSRSLTMDVMYALGISTAYGASIAGTFGILPGHEFMLYETAIMLSGFLILGRFLENRAKGKTTSSIRKLINLQPKKAVVVRDGTEVVVPVESIEMGEMVIIKPGEQVPVDGKVVKGESSIDESMVSGEPFPVYKNEDCSVTAGTINKSGVITVVSERIGKDTVLARIIKLVKDAQSSRPPVQLFADKVVSVFIPVILGVAITAFLIWWLATAAPLQFALTVLIAVVVIACPCALGLASPTAVTVGIGRGAELGILIKNGDVLERTQSITTVVFDKTGTLTEGKPVVKTAFSTQGNDRELLTLAASVEKGSLHPLAEAIVDYAQKNGCNLKPFNALHTFEGRGVRAEIDGKMVLVGNERLLQEEGIQIPDEVRKHAEGERGESHVFIATDKICIGMISVADTIRDDAAVAVRALQKMGIEVMMLTGDNREAAQHVGSVLGIDNVMAGVLPDQKAEKIRELRASGKKVTFVGDGINDAAALALADVGIAIGGGTDVAIETGEIVLIKNSLRDAVASLQLGKRIIRQIKMNIFWAFAYNAALIPLAAGVLKPWFGIVFKPELAGLAMAMSSVTVVTFSLMLRNYVPEILAGK
ncbi:MAG TPA: heavy metal translocating P-type ATPase [Chitinispirillaceae bacterium]|nr:heavy metal translocating P-type ATPase [Chitinispirillaceae bacterium]